MPSAGVFLSVGEAFFNKTDKTFVESVGFETCTVALAPMKWVASKSGRDICLAIAWQFFFKEMYDCLTFVLLGLHFNVQNTLI